MLARASKLNWMSVLIAAISVALASCGGEEGGHGSHGGGHSGGHASKKPASHGSGHGGGHGGGHGSGHGGGHGASGHGTKSAAETPVSAYTPTEAAELLNLLEIGGHHDPSRFVEIEIGTFRVTHKVAGGEHSVLLKFRLFGIVPESKQAYLYSELPKFEKRIRDAVISLVQKSEAEQLEEPGLKWLKAELVAAINRVVQDRALHDVAFSDFSMEGV